MNQNIPQNTSETFQHGNSSAVKTIERIIFLLLMLIAAGILLYLISGRCTPGGSDGFKLQYCFLNNVVNYGEIPKWCPFLTHGAVTTWWYICQGGIHQYTLLLFENVSKGLIFLSLFSGDVLLYLIVLTAVFALRRPQKN